MGITTLSVTAPPELAQVAAGDVDGDGVDELIFVSRPKAGSAPDKTTLVFVSLDAAGAVRWRKELALGNKPLAWDATGGLYGLDREGLVRLSFEGGEATRVAKFTTPFAGLGSTTPVRADLTHDLTGDELPELLTWSNGKFLAYRTDGTALGSFAAAGEGTISGDWESGGAMLTATQRPPPLVVADMDGDGRNDLLLPDGDVLKVAYTGASALGERSATVGLPVDLSPMEDLVSGETHREPSGVWFQDFDGDKRADLLVQMLVFNGTWFGATTELVFAKGLGSGFGAATTIPLNAAVFNVDVLDADNDGDRDIIAWTAEVDFGNLARALVSRKARMDMKLLAMDNGRFGTPTLLRSFDWPLEAPDTLHIQASADVDGDGRLDLVTDDGLAMVRVYRGQSGGISSTPTWSHSLTVPKGDDSIFVHDLTGDGKAEIVVWGKNLAAATVLRVQ